jgi:vacuolar-type H+-ATPase subunit E/Vma4
VTGVATVPSPPRGRGTRADRERAAIEASLVPVVDAITDAARARAQGIRAAAAADARAELARAHQEATRIVDEARAAGTEAATVTATSELTVARREARERVLTARRQAYETVREGALAELVRQAATPDARRLAERLQTLVRDRVGASASVHSAGPGNLGAVAESGNRRAELEPGDLVDRALESLGAGIEALWA